MSFRRSQNIMDHWKNTISRYSREFSTFPNIEAVLRNPKLFEKLLVEGVADGATLSDFNDAQFLSLEVVVNYWFGEFVGGSGHLDCFNEARLSRFGRYG